MGTTQYIQFNNFSKPITTETDMEFGKGWGINIQTNFGPIFGLKYSINLEQGLVIDLYNTIFNTPFNITTFSIIETTILEDYFAYRLVDNLLFIIPNKSKIISDLYLSDNFVIKYNVTNDDGITIENTIEVDYNFENNLQISEFNLNYDKENFEINLDFLDLDNNATFDLVSKNGIVLSQLEKTKMLYNKKITLELLELNSLVLIKKIDNSERLINLNFTDLSNKINSTIIIKDIDVTISKYTGKLINLFDYVICERNLKNITINIENNYDVIDVVSTNSCINISPNQNTLNLTGSQIREFRVSYSNGINYGYFYLNILIDANIKANPTKSQDFTLTTIEGSANDDIYVNNLVTNKININDVRIVSCTNTNIKFTNIGKPRILTRNIIVTEPFSIGLMYENVMYYSTINIKGFNSLVRENLFVKPIYLECSKNNGDYINILEYIKTSLENYQVIDVDLNPGADINSVKLIGNTDLLYIDSSVYKDTKLFNTYLFGSINIKVSSKYKDDLTTDDYGNILGYREIPYFIHLKDSNNLDELGADPIFENVKIHKSNFIAENVFEINSKTIVKNIDYKSHIANISKFVSVECLDSTIDKTNINIITDETKIDPDKINIFWDQDGFKITNILYNIFTNVTLLLKYQYTNKNSITKSFTQKITFSKYWENLNA